MPIISPHLEDPTVDGRQSDQAMRVRRGIIKQFQELNVFFLPEFTLSTGRRADLVGVDPKGEILIVEIKSSVADFNADSKWAEY
ncbi:MAG: MmcB family DNA repair protein, partial [Pseudomonadota bacterium]